jgi:hypothetical protein
MTGCDRVCAGGRSGSHLPRHRGRTATCSVGERRRLVGRSEEGVVEGRSGHALELGRRTLPEESQQRLETAVSRQHGRDRSLREIRAISVGDISPVPASSLGSPPPHAEAETKLMATITDSDSLTIRNGARINSVSLKRLTDRLTTFAWVPARRCVGRICALWVWSLQPSYPGCVPEDCRGPWEGACGCKRGEAGVDARSTHLAAFRLHIRTRPAPRGQAEHRLAQRSGRRRLRNVCTQETRSTSRSGPRVR